MLSAAAEPSGPVTREAFDHFAGLIVAAAEEEKAELDGILLGLHGAMVTEFCEDGEGELLEGCAPSSGRSCRSASRSTFMPM